MWCLPKNLIWEVALEEKDEERDLADAKMLFLMFKGAYEAGKYRNGAYNSILRRALQAIWLESRPKRRSPGWPWSKDAREIYIQSMKESGKTDGKGIANKLVMEHVISAKTITDKLLAEMDDIIKQPEPEKAMLKVLKEFHKDPYLVVISKEEDKLLSRGDGWERYEACGFDHKTFMKLTDDPEYIKALNDLK